MAWNGERFTNRPLITTHDIVPVCSNCIYYDENAGLPCVPNYITQRQRILAPGDTRFSDASYAAGQCTTHLRLVKASGTICKTFKDMV